MREVGHGLAEKAAGREAFFIGQHGGEGAAGEFQTGEDATDGGAAQADGLGDAHSGPALTTGLF